MYKWTTGAWEDAQHHWSLESCNRNNNEIRLHTHQEDYNKRENNNCWKGYEKSGTFLHCCTKIVYGDSVIPWLFMSLDFIWNVSFLFFLYRLHPLEFIVMQFTAVWVPSFLLRSRLISEGAGLQVLLPSRSAHSHRDEAFRNYLTNDTVPRLGMSKVTYCSVSPESLEPNLYLFIKKKKKTGEFL